MKEGTVTFIHFYRASVNDGSHQLKTVTPLHSIRSNKAETATCKPGARGGQELSHYQNGCLHLSHKDNNVEDFV